MAIAGLLLGLLFIAIYAGGIYGYAVLIQPVVKSTTGFVEKLTAGDVSGARAFATADVSDQDLKNASDTFSTMGKFKNLQLQPGMPMTWNDMRFTGKLVFDNGTKQVNVRITKQPDGIYKFTEFAIQ
jgi:hypothetical protein